MTPVRFDARRRRRHRARAAAGFAAHDFLIRATAPALLERLDIVRRDFPRALDVDGRQGLLSRLLGEMLPGRVAEVITCEPAAAWVTGAPGPALAAAAEALPLADASVDLVVSHLGLHWANAPDRVLVELRRVLRPDGLLLASLWGERSLWELRDCLTRAEETLTGRARPRIAPLVSVQAAGSLLGAAGFQGPVADTETTMVTYGDPLRLLHDLRGMGEASVIHPGQPLRRAVLALALADYQQRYGDAAGRVPATFEVVTLTGWTPTPGQAAAPACAFGA